MGLVPISKASAWFLKRFILGAVLGVCLNVGKSVWWLNPSSLSACLSICLSVCVSVCLSLRSTIHGLRTENQVTADSDRLPRCAEIRFQILDLFARDDSAVFRQWQRT